MKSKSKSKLRPPRLSKLTRDVRWKEQRADGKACFEPSQVDWSILGTMWKIATLAAALSCCLYMNTIYADFAYDDSRAILKNQDIRPETPISNIWFDDFWGTPLRHSGSHKSYRPLVVLSFRINYALHQLHPGGYHLTNIVCHALATFIYTQAIALISRRTFVTTVAGILFAIHPIHSEAVAGIVGRADVLCSIFFLLSILTFMRYCELQESQSRQRFMWIALTFSTVVVSTLCKELGITVLGVCLSYYIFYHNRLSLRELLQPDKVKMAAEPVLLLLPFGVSTFIARLYFMGYSPPSFSPADNPAADSDSLLTRTLTFLYLPVFNFVLLVYPAILSFDWSMEAITLLESLTDYRVISIISFYASLCWLVKYSLSYCCTSTEECDNSSISSPQKHKHFATLESKVRNGDGFHSTWDNVIHRRCRKDSSSSSEVSSYDENQNELHEAPAASSTNSHRHHGIMILSLSMLILPFLPATNLFFYVGFVVAERVLYIPSMGFCLLVGELAYQLHKKIKRKKNKQILLKAFLVGAGILLGLRCYLRCLDWKSEEQLYKSGLAINPAKAWGNLANILNNRGDVSGAEAAYRSALSHRGNMADVHYNLGILLQNEKRYEEALMEYSMAIKCRPKLTVAHLNKGIVHALLGQHTEAIQSYKDTTVIDTSGLKEPRMHETAKISALYNLGRLHAERKEYTLAISTYKHALKRRPEYYSPQSIYNLLGEAYFHSGKLDNAEWAYRRSIEAKSDHLPAHLTMARLMNIKKLYDDAENWYRRALQIDANDTQNYYHYALFLSEHGRHQEALSLWQKACAISPSDFNTVFNLANAFRQVGLFEDAVEQYEKAVSLAPQSATAHMNLGAIHHMSKNYDLAEKSYTRALELDPTDNVAQSNLKKLQNIMLRSKG